MATLVTDILDRAARQCSVTAPASWVSATEAAALELKDFLLETVDDILERVDPPSPLGKQTTIAGDGSSSYALPTDFKRLGRGMAAVYETSPVRRIVRRVPDDGMWTVMEEENSFAGERFYRLQGYDGARTIEFLDDLATGGSITVTYVSDAWLTDGTYDFDDVTQTTVIPRRILETGTVWRYRERRGHEYDGKRAEYDALLTRWVNEAKAARVIDMSGPSQRYPWEAPLPDFIPSGS